MKRAFTLIELLVVIGVMAVIAAGVIATINPQQKIFQARDSNSQNAIGQIASALQAFAAQNAAGTYPTVALGLGDLITTGELVALPAFPAGVTTWNYQGAPVAAPTAVAIYAVMQATRNGSATNQVWCWRSALGNAGFSTVAACVPL